VPKSWFAVELKSTTVFLLQGLADHEFEINGVREEDEDDEADVP